MFKGLMIIDTIMLVITAIIMFGTMVRNVNDESISNMTIGLLTIGTLGSLLAILLLWI